MYFWKVDSLVDDFKQNKVTQKEEMKYILLFSILEVLNSESFINVNQTNFYDTLNSVLLLIFTIIGILYCYKVNSEGDNKDFMVRLIAIGLPVMIRVTVIGIPILIIGVIMESSFLLSSEESDSGESTVMLVIISTLFMIGYYWYLSKKIKEVSH